MKMSTKGRYAVRILLCIARHQKNGAVSKKLISQEERISADYIEQIITPLKNKKLVTSLRGTKGGFQLAKEPSQITVYDVLCATDGELILVNCHRNNCHERDLCVTRLVWDGASQKLVDYFSGITLKSLLDQRSELEKNKTVSYAI